jgi:predicted kinase
LVPARRPVLIVVCGHPATGKTTFARNLGQRLALPVFNKDTIKELLWDRLGEGDVDWSHRLGIASFGLLDTIAEIELRSGRTVIVEGNFHSEYGMSLQEVVDRTGADVLQVVVGGDPEVVLRRFRQRAGDITRHPAHPDEQLVPEIEERVRAGYDPPPLRGVRVDVDLTDVDDEVVSAALDEVAQALEVAFPEST